MADRTYFVGAAVLWVALMAADPDFLVLSLGVFAPLCLHDLAWGTVALVGTGGVWLWLQWTEGGSIPWNTVLAVGMVVAAGLLGVGYFGTVMRQNRERQRLIEELRRAQAELAEAERQGGMMEERQRLARDIHDTLTQGFASIVMLLEAASASLEGDARSRRHVGRALETARENLAESRRLVWAMRTAVLADASLAEVLERLGAQLRDDTGIRVETVVTGSPRRLHPEVETAFLRIAQEALANVRQHANASAVTLTLSYMDDPVVLDVLDDGIGFVQAPGGSGVGLAAMRERAAALGGTLTVESAPGEGTTVVAEIPAAKTPLTPAVGDPP
jgi:signal transduction histidine kinase